MSRLRGAWTRLEQSPRDRPGIEVGVRLVERSLHHLGSKALFPQTLACRVGRLSLLHQPSCATTSQGIVVEDAERIAALERLYDHRRRIALAGQALAHFGARSHPKVERAHGVDEGLLGLSPVLQRGAARVRQVFADPQVLIRNESDGQRRPKTVVEMDADDGLSCRWC